MFVCADPPADDGGAEITKFIVELDDGQGECSPLFALRQGAIVGVGG